MGPGAGAGPRGAGLTAALCPAALRQLPLLRRVPDQRAVGGHRCPLRRQVGAGWPWGGGGGRGCAGCPWGSASALPRTTDAVVLGEYDQETESGDVQRLSIAKVRPARGRGPAGAVATAGSPAGPSSPGSGPLGVPGAPRIGDGVPMESPLLLSSGLGSLGWALGLGPCSLAPTGPRRAPWGLSQVPPVPPRCMGPRQPLGCHRPP